MFNSSVFRFERYRYTTVLLRQLVKTDFKLRYQGSVLGYLWTLLKPLMLFVIMYMVFVKVLKVDYGVGNSGAYLLLALVLWTFFTELTSGGVGAVVGKGDILRKLNFPRYVLVLAPAVSALINMTINLGIVAIVIIMGGADIDWRIIFAPLLMLQLLLFGVAIAFFLSAAYVKLRDVGHVWEVTVQILFYATPIFFPITLAPVWAQKMLILSPLAQSIQDLRFTLVSTDTTTIETVYNGNSYMRIIPIGITIVSLVIFGRYFRSRSKYFAEEI